jgi:hypothetical protein
MNRNPRKKIARQRLSVLELAQALGNVSEACRRRGISRTTFYDYKQRFVQEVWKVSETYRRFQSRTHSQKFLREPCPQSTSSGCWR